MKRESQSESGLKMEAAAQLERQLRASAPQPRDGFEQELAAALAREWTQRSRAKRALRAEPHRMRRLSPLAAVIALALLTVGVGIVIAVSGILQQLLGYDAGLKAILDQGLGHEIGISQTHGDFTVTLIWAYADGNRLSLAYEIAGEPGEQYTNLESRIYDLTLRDTGEAIPFYQGRGIMLDANGEIFVEQPPEGELLTTDRVLKIWDHDLSTLILADRDALDLRFEVDVLGITLAQRTALPLERMNEMYEGPEEHFIFDFSVPLVNDQRVLAAPQTATDQDITFTLERVTVVPSQTRVVVCYLPPDPARKWTSIPHLTTDSGDVPGGGSVQPYMDGDRTCDAFTYFAGMFDYQGEWRLEMSELVGFGSGGGADQVRIAGSWVFQFSIP